MQEEEEQVQCGGDQVGAAEDSAIASRQGFCSFLKYDQMLFPRNIQR